MFTDNDIRFDWFIAKLRSARIQNRHLRKSIFWYFKSAFAYLELSSKVINSLNAVLIFRWSDRLLRRIFFDGVVHFCGFLDAFSDFNILSKFWPNETAQRGRSKRFHVWNFVSWKELSVSNNFSTNFSTHVLP